MHLRVKKEDTTPREYIGWLSIWREGADKYDLPRVLLIGDSIVDAHGPAVQEELKGKYYVDRIATSRSFDQDYYWNLLDFFFSDTKIKYDLIIFNFGLHGFHVPTYDYGIYLDKLTKRLKRECSKVLYRNLTPMVNSSGEEWNEKQIGLVIDRNEVAEKVMAGNGVEILDLYTPMLDKDDIRLPDPYHFNEKGIALQAKIIAEKVRELI